MIDPVDIVYIILANLCHIIVLRMRIVPQLGTITAVKYFAYGGRTHEVKWELTQGDEYINFIVILLKIC